MNLSEMISEPMAANFWSGINAFTGAAVGACFYVLTKTQPYLANRSYDPKYNAAYISRFIIGVISGVILAVAIGPTLAVRLGSTAGETLTPGVLAILGGYAAEAVELILQRLAEILLSVVRGDGSSQAQSKVSTQTNLQNVRLIEQLSELDAAQADPVKLKASIDQLRASLKKNMS